MGMNIESGQLYDKQEYEALPPAVKDKTVLLSPEDKQAIQGMNRKQRREWMKANNKFKKEK